MTPSAADLPRDPEAAHSSPAQRVARADAAAPAAGGCSSGLTRGLRL